MDKKDVIEFFDTLASDWDADMIRNDEIINKILDGAGVKEGVKVLDVACGTGVLIPDYLERKAASVIGVDISQEMIKIAKRKFFQENVKFICGDIEMLTFEEQFDCIVLYNAFPHFPEQERLIKTLTGMLKNGGTLTIAHGMSREQIDRHHHSSAAKKVSIGLISEAELAKMFEPELDVVVKVSDEKMYQVSGVKRNAGKY